MLLCQNFNIPGGIVIYRTKVVRRNEATVT